MKNTRRISLAASVVVPVVAVAAAEAAAPRIAEDAYSITLYAIVVLFSMFCGSITFAKAYLRNDGQKHLLVRWFVDASSAAVGGLVCFWIGQSQGWSLWLTGILIAATSMGWASIVDVVRGLIGRNGIPPGGGGGS